jgi:hypothetical protein
MQEKKDSHEEGCIKGIREEIEKERRNIEATVSCKQGLGYTPVNKPGLENQKSYAHDEEHQEQISKFAATLDR